MLIEIGKTKSQALTELLNDLTKRVKRFHQFEVISIKDARLSKSSGANEHKSIEAETLKKALLPGDLVILLDERGQQFNSRGFSKYLNRQLQLGKARIVFVIGGAYGFDKSVYELASNTMALSSLTFSHQLIRLIFMEQLYRAFTIINNHPYHND